MQQGGLTMGYKMGIFGMLLALSQNHQAFADTKNMIVIDVRTADEYQETHVKDTLNIDIRDPDFKSKVAKLDKTKTYKLYCRSGNRSGQAEAIMKSLGFKDVENIGSVKQAAKSLNRECEGKSC